MLLWELCRHQLVEWAQGGSFVCFDFTRQACRDTWFRPKSCAGHPIDHLLCRPRDQGFV